MTAGDALSPFPDRTGLCAEDPGLPGMEGRTEGDPAGPTGLWPKPDNLPGYSQGWQRPLPDPHSQIAGGPVSCLRVWKLN